MIPHSWVIAALLGSLFWLAVAMVIIEVAR